MKKLFVVLALVTMTLAPAAAARATVIFGVGQPAVISGSGKVGEALVITTPTEWTPEPDRRSYEWVLEGAGDGEGDVLSTSTSYTPTAEVVGRFVRLVETAEWTDADGTQVDKSESEAIEVLPVDLVPPTVSVTGSPVVGSTLGFVRSGGTEDVALAPQWLRNGVVIGGSTDVTRLVTNADAGTTISLRVTSSKAGYDPVVSTSTPVSARRIAARNTSRPTISGTAVVGRTLKVKSKGTWFGVGYAYTYQWLRNGSAISAATKTSYKLTSKDKGRKISLKVTARKTGFGTVTATSASSSSVKQ